MGYLHYSHKGTNEKWLAQTLTELCGIDIQAGCRKISKPVEDDSRVVHVECDRNQGERVQSLLRETCTKDSKGVTATEFPLIFVPNRMYLQSVTSKAGASIVANMQASLVKTLQTRMSWGIGGLDVTNKIRKITLRVMISIITHTGVSTVILSATILLRVP